MPNPFAAGVASVVKSLGDAGTLVTGSQSYSMTAIVQRDFNQIDEHGAIGDRGNLLSFAKSALPGTLKNGDSFTVSETSEKFIIQRTVADDGYSVQVLAR